MAIIGSLIKRALEIKAQLTPEGDAPVDQQRAQLRSLLSKAKETAIGLYYDYSGILEVDDVIQEFQNRVPIFDYHTMDDLWWSQQQKYPNITWPGHPDFFALSSGTTGSKSKRIPITYDLINAMRSVGFDQLTDFSLQDVSDKVFEKEILMLSSSADLSSNSRGFMEGEISGINVNNFPDWYETFFRPGKDIAQIAQWDERVKRIAEEAPSWDIGAICGIPSWVLMMLEEIVEKNKLTSIHEIWPDLQVFVSGGVAFEPYRDKFDSLVDHEIFYMDTYLASEGFFGYTPSAQKMDMKLAIDHGIFYEFVPFDKDGFDGTGQILNQPTIHTIDQVEEDREYALLISTCAGAWRYMIGDTVRFTNKKDLLFRIAGRTKFFLNVVGSQLSEEKINAAIKKTAAHFDVTIEEFCVGALKDQAGDIYHQWVIGTDDVLDEDEVVLFLDETLEELNKNYRVARSKALKKVKLKAVKKDHFYEALSGSKEKGGQLKTPKVMPTDKLQAFLDNLEKLGH